MRISPGPGSSYVASRKTWVEVGHLDAQCLPALSCPLRHQDSYSIVLPGLLIFLPVSLMVIVVYGLWKKRHRGSEYNPLSRPPAGRGRARGLDTLAKAPDCTLSPSGLSSSASSHKDCSAPRQREEGGGRAGRQEQHGMTLQG